MHDVTTDAVAAPGSTTTETTTDTMTTTEIAPEAATSSPSGAAGTATTGQAGTTDLPGPAGEATRPAMRGIADTSALTEAGFADVGSVDDIPMLEGRQATVDGRRVAVFRLPTGFAATDAACPHKGGPLSDGLVADGCVTCPLHNWRLDLTTGVVKGDDTVVPIHDVLVLDGRLWVRIAAGAGPAAAKAPPVTAGDARRLWDPSASGATTAAAESAPSLADGPGGRPADDARTAPTRPDDAAAA